MVREHVLAIPQPSHYRRSPSDCVRWHDPPTPESTQIEEWFVKNMLIHICLEYRRWPSDDYTTVQTWNMDCVRWHDPQLNLNQRMVCEKYFFLHSHNCSEYPRSPSDDYHHTVFSCLWCLPAPTLPKSEIFQIQNMKAWTFQIDEQSIPFLEFPEAVIDMSYKV